jgi:RNA polymerase sigma-70 factor, ECF subfamily
MASNPKFSERALIDLELVRSAIEDGDQSAYSKLMDRYRDSIFFMILKMVHNRDDAEDLTIEAFGKAFKNIEKYSPEFAFSTWLFKISTNNAIDFIRKKRLKTMSIDGSKYDDGEGASIASNLPSSRLDPEETFIKDQRKAQMREVIEKLNDKYRILIELRYFKEFSYDEIAAELNLPLGTVKAQLFRAKELLYTILKNRKEKI